MITREELLNKCLTETSIFKSSVLGGDIKIRQLTISESEQMVRIQQDQDKTMSDVFKYCVKCSMVEPTFFTDEELEKLGRNGKLLIEEIFNAIPYIGMSEKEKKEYDEKIAEFLKANKESKKTQKEEEEETEKK